MMKLTKSRYGNPHILLRNHGRVSINKLYHLEMSSLYHRIILFYGVRISIGLLIVKVLLLTSRQTLRVEELQSRVMMQTIS